MTRVVSIIISITALVGCGSVLPPTPTPVDFVLPSPTVETTQTPAPTLTPTPTQLTDTLPERLISGNATGRVSFEAEAGDTFSITVRVSEGTPLVNVSVRGPLGNTLMSITGEAVAADVTINSITVPYVGTHTIILEAVTGAGTVQVAIDDIAPPEYGGRVDPFTGAQGAMPEGNTLHTFRTTFEAGQHISLRSSLAFTDITLYDPRGDLVTQVGTNSPPFTITEGGDYTLTVTHTGIGGPYTVQAIDETQPPPPPDGEADIQAGQTVGVRLIEGDILRVTFDGTRGDVIRVRVFDTSEDLAADVLVISPYDQYMAVVNAGEIGTPTILNQLQLPLTGRYTVVLRPTGEGNASLLIEQLPQEALTGGGTFGSGEEEVLAGDFTQPGQFHVMQFDATYGDILTLALRRQTQTETFTPVFTLIAPDGKQIAFSEEALLEAFNVRQNGIYTLIVYTLTDAGGRYEITLERQ